jgi:hypothetical protein
MMHCPSCGCENRTGAKFCNECGVAMVLLCSSCGTENRPGAKFCNECGTFLTGKAPSSRVQVPSSSEPSAPQTPNPELRTDQPPIAYTPVHLADPSLRSLPGATQEERVVAPREYTPTHLAERILAAQAAMEARGSANGERKTITALPGRMPA